MKYAILFLTIGSFAWGVSGAQIYKRCAGCHGIEGEKSAVGVSAVIKGQNAARTIKQLKAYKKGALDQYGMGKLMNKYAKRLSDKDIEAVAHYISTLH